METRLIWITPEAEKLIGYIARVSNPKNQDNPSIEGLLSYCIRHNHWSPFEMVSACVEIKTSRAIAAQILRHRSFSFQEFSQRYSTVTTFEPIEIRKQATKNRQSSLEVFSPIFPTGFFTYAKEDTEHKNMIPYNKTANDLIQDHIELSKVLYQKLINAGVAKEVARLILPMTTQTTMYMSGTVRSWIHYINLRTQPDTQKEHQEVAQSIKSILMKELPYISTVLGWPEI